ncbi:uncharacterized protein [Brachionichthys hirsutus]|uniref:uncharacterized protein n=1 Tax=Brachionichthys hirsutus TaxID=412623 RepID=UPI003604F798
MFSQSEVQALIEQEVCSAVKKSETILQGLTETFQQLDSAIDYENTIRKLEDRINIVTQRAEAALKCMTKEKIPVPSLADGHTNRLDSGEAAELTPQNNDTNGTENSGELFEFMKLTRKTPDKMHHDNKALMAATGDLKEAAAPVVIAHGSSNSQKKADLGKEKDSEAPMNSEDTVKERASPVNGSHLEHKSDQTKTKAMYPPLPPTIFPSILIPETASYNIPQKPVVRLALIRNPANLSVLWDVAEVDPSAPPMDSYSVLMTMETAKGSGVFSKWNTVGEVTAIPLPICVMISNYKPGHKVCVAVVGKDKFGRDGPYSEVVTASIPDS